MGQLPQNPDLQQNIKTKDLRIYFKPTIGIIMKAFFVIL